MQVKTSEDSQPNEQRLISNKSMFSFNVTLSDMAVKTIKKTKHTAPVVISSMDNEQSKNNKGHRKTLSSYNNHKALHANK